MVADEFTREVLNYLQLKHTFPEDIFFLTNLPLLMFPESTEVAYLQWETAFLGLFCVVTRRAADNERK
jgi:hypothetical protein